ncbi:MULTISPECIES: hypothetical protein [unclassified Acinetobacter calcoaceticus/baumannii complex]|uniref:hypothetical protein n=1 Tax=unclassified Acinetobacter calcoaceticus/baumannii complex TaxID=2881046 RepID=UPI000452F514|nr:MULTISPECIES: hypothetical protein [unclassified Acinetobacter calcoaceticus/baumannii complex]EXH77441.1 hypothetical protein J633_1351 [Acinetobacter sp. 216872]PRV96061.1 hypothetical protein CSB87_0484 [Acinetobacter sp. AR_0276]
MQKPHNNGVLAYLRFIVAMIFDRNDTKGVENLESIKPFYRLFKRYGQREFGEGQ